MVIELCLELACETMPAPKVDGVEVLILRRAGYDDSDSDSCTKPAKDGENQT